jgi:ParB-like chromosome segregation protein Spo0J
MDVAQLLKGTTSMSSIYRTIQQLENLTEGLDADQQRARQMPADFNPRSIRALGSKTDPQHPADKHFVGGESEDDTKNESIAVIPPEFPEEWSKEKKKAAWNKWIRDNIKRSIEANKEVQALAQQIQQSKQEKERGTNESTGDVHYAIVHKVAKKVLSTHDDLESAKDEWRGLDQDQRSYYKVVKTTKPKRDWTMTEDESDKLDYCDACDRVITERPHVCPGSEKLAEDKITLSTDPNWYGAEVGNYRATSPVVNVPAKQLVGFEPDDKMNQSASRANVAKIVAGIKQGAKLPPLLVRRYKNGYQVLDGHHRFWAYKLSGVKNIPVQVVPDSDIEEKGQQSISEVSQDRAEINRAAEQIAKILDGSKGTQWGDYTLEQLKQIQQLAKITGRRYSIWQSKKLGREMRVGSIIDLMSEFVQKKQRDSGQMPEFTGRAATAKDMAKQIALQTNGQAEWRHGTTWTTGYGRRYKDPQDYVAYGSDKAAYDDAWKWVEGKGKKVHYKDNFGDLKTAVQIGNYIIQPSTKTRGPFSDNPTTEYSVSVRSAKAIGQPTRTKQDITDQQAAAIRDIANTRGENAMQMIKALINVLDGEKDVQRVIDQSKKIDPKDKAKLDQIIAGAGGFREMQEAKMSAFRQRSVNQQIDLINQIKNMELPKHVEEYLVSINDPKGQVYKLGYYSFPKGQEAREQLRHQIAKKYNVTPDELEQADLYFRAQLSGNLREMDMGSPEFQQALARLKKMAAQGPLKTAYDPKTKKYRNVPVDQKSEPVKESADHTYEDILSKLKTRLGDYLGDVAQAVKDTDLSDKPTPTSDTVNAVKTVMTDDGHEIRIHGNEDDGFRITIKNKDSKSKFASLKEAEMAAEMYRHRRQRSSRIPRDYESEK